MFGTGVTSELNVEDNFKIHKMGYFKASFYNMCSWEFLWKFYNEAKPVPFFYNDGTLLAVHKFPSRPLINHTVSKPAGKSSLVRE